MSQNHAASRYRPRATRDHGSGQHRIGSRREAAASPATERNRGSEPPTSGPRVVQKSYGGPGQHGSDSVSIASQTVRFCYDARGLISEFELEWREGRIRFLEIACLLSEVGVRCTFQDVPTRPGYCAVRCKVVVQGEGHSPSPVTSARLKAALLVLMAKSALRGLEVDRSS